MLKNKKLIAITVIFILTMSSILIVFKIDEVSNLPRYKTKIWNNAFKIFMKLPDPLKSSLMIFSGKRSFSNLFNDYNVKFLPETQYISIDYFKKKISFEKNFQHTFYLETFKDKLITVTKNGDFYRSKLIELNFDKKNINNIKLQVNNLFEKKGKIFDTLIINNKIFVTKTSIYDECNKLEIHFAEIKSVLNFKMFKSFDECISIGNGAGRIQNYVFNGND